MKKTVIGIGEILWDIFPDRKTLGGAPTNFAFHASQLGLNSYIVSAIGKDTLAKDIIETLKVKSLNNLIQQTDFPTGQVQITLDNQGIPNYKILENVAWDNIPYSHSLNQLAVKSDIICFGSLAQRSLNSRTTIHKLLQSAPKHAVKIFDINLRENFYTKEIIEESLKLCSVLKLNEDEVVIINELFSLKSTNNLNTCKLLLNLYNIDIVILTNGDKDSYIFTDKETSHLPTPKIKIADTVGAGDSFTAAFITSYIHDYNISKAHELAIEVSAYVCTQQGGMPILPEIYKQAFDLH